MSRYITTTVDVDVDLSDFDDDDLIDEIESRGLNFNTKGVDGDSMRMLLEIIWLKKRTGQPFDSDLDLLIYNGLGKLA